MIVFLTWRTHLDDSEWLHVPHTASPRLDDNIHVYKTRESDRKIGYMYWQRRNCCDAWIRKKSISLERLDCSCKRTNPQFSWKCMKIACYVTMCPWASRHISRTYFDFIDVKERTYTSIAYYRWHCNELFCEIFLSVAFHCSSYQEKIMGLGSVKTLSSWEGIDALQPPAQT